MLSKNFAWSCKTELRVKKVLGTNGTASLERHAGRAGGLYLCRAKRCHAEIRRGEFAIRRRSTGPTDYAVKLHRTGNGISGTEYSFIRARGQNFLLLIRAS